MRTLLGVASADFMYSPASLQGASGVPQSVDTVVSGRSAGDGSGTDRGVCRVSGDGAVDRTDRSPEQPDLHAVVGHDFADEHILGTGWRQNSAGCPSCCSALTSYGVLLGVLAFILRMGVAGASASFVLAGMPGVPRLARRPDGGRVAVGAGRIGGAIHRDGTGRQHGRRFNRVRTGIAGRPRHGSNPFALWRAGELVVLQFRRHLPRRHIGALPRQSRNTRSSRRRKDSFRLTRQLFWCLLLSCIVLHRISWNDADHRLHRAGSLSRIRRPRRCRWRPIGFLIIAVATIADPGIDQ